MASPNRFNPAAGQLAAIAANRPAASMPSSPMPPKPGIAVRPTVRDNVYGGLRSNPSPRAAAMLQQQAANVAKTAASTALANPALGAVKPLAPVAPVAPPIGARPGIQRGPIAPQQLKGLQSKLGLARRF